MKCQGMYKYVIAICICFLIASCTNDFFILSGMKDEAKLMDYVEPIELKMLEKMFKELPLDVQGAVENSVKIVANRQVSQFSKITHLMAGKNDDKIEAIIEESANELLDVIEESLIFAQTSAGKKTPKQIERHIVNFTSPKIQHIHFRLKQRLQVFIR